MSFLSPIALYYGTYHVELGAKLGAHGIAVVGHHILEAHPQLALKQPATTEAAGAGAQGQAREGLLRVTVELEVAPQQRHVR